MGHVGWRQGSGTVSLRRSCLRKDVSKGALWVSGGKVFQGGGNSLCKSPEAEACLVRLTMRRPVWLEKNEQGEGGDGGREGKGQIIWAWCAMRRTLASTFSKWEP